MKNRQAQKVILGTVLLIAVVILGIAASVSAAGEGAPVTQPTGQTGEDTARQLTWLESIIQNTFGKILVLAAGLVDFAVRLGNDVLTLDAVQTGWKVVLSLVNLAFVLAIIVIAFATIFQLQSYAMKQTLWKLIVAALLVNFSLVIAGAFISISNNLTDIFITASIGENGANLSTALANAIQPQKLATPPDEGWLMSTITGGFIKKFFEYIAALFFIIIFTFLAILAFLSLFIMLLVRAIALVFLLVLSPAIWLFWIFPYTQQYWQRWWKEFIRWNFFAPVVLFFIYLTVRTAAALQSSGEQSALTSVTGAQSTYDSAASVLGKVVSIQSQGGFFRYVAELLVILAMLFGGIYMANSFGIAGGGLAYGWAAGAGKMFGGWAGRKGIRAGTFPFRSEPGRKFVEKLQEGKSGLFKAASYVGGMRLGHALSRAGVMQGEQLLKQAQDRQKQFSDKQLALRVATMSREERTAALSRLAKNQNLDMVPNVAKYIADPSTQKIFESYGKKQEYGDFEKTFGADTATLMAKTPQERKRAMEAFTQKHSIKDYDKLQRHILTKYDAKENNLGLSEELHNEIRELKEKVMFERHPGAITKVRAKLKGQGFIDFQNDLDEYIKTFENERFPEKYKERQLRGIEVPIKFKLEYIDKEMKPEWRNWARGIYNSQKSFGGSLFGAYYVAERERGEATEEAI